MNKKEIGYHLFAAVYKFCCLFPKKEKRVFFIMTHDAGEEGNVGVVKKYLEESETDWEFISLTRKDTQFGGSKKFSKLWTFFIKKAYGLATSSYVFQDNIFLPMAFLRFNKKVKVVQLWHGTGTIKKFGQDSNQGRIKELEQRANQTITHLIVNAKEWKEKYSHIFAVEEDKTFITGMPRTDLLFEEDKKEERVEQFYKENPNLVGKRLVLYAPTFRDGELEEQKVRLDLEEMVKKLPEDTVIGLKLHPFVADQFHYDGNQKERVIDLSHESNLNTLLFASQCLITDYSSIVFEYVLLNKPIYFYAYDLEEFSDHGRGFYEDYESYVPGPVSKTTKQLLEQIKEEKEGHRKEYWEHRRKEFQKRNYEFEDGNSTRRLLRLLEME